MDTPRKDLYKIVVLGDAGVGKTAILNRFVADKFTQSYRTTVGADFMSKVLPIDDREITLQIWDTAGQERFQSIGTAFYRGSDCCILVYDITNPESFENLDNWKDAFLASAAPRHPETYPFVVLGNKVDMESERKITKEQGQEWAKRNHNMPFFEVSAKENINIQEAFTEVSVRVTKHDEEDDHVEFQTVKIKETTPKKEKSGCC